MEDPLPSHIYLRLINSYQLNLVILWHQSLLCADDWIQQDLIIANDIVIILKSLNVL